MADALANLIKTTDDYLTWAMLNDMQFARNLNALRASDLDINTVEYEKNHNQEMDLMEAMRDAIDAIAPDLDRQDAINLLTMRKCTEKNGGGSTKLRECWHDIKPQLAYLVIRGNKKEKTPSVNVDGRGNSKKETRPKMADAARVSAPTIRLSATDKKILNMCKRKHYPGKTIALKLFLTHDYIRQLCAKLVKAGLLANDPEKGYRTR